MDAVNTALAELEAQCARLEPLIEAHDWSALDALVADMGRARHALTNAWESTEGQRTPEFEREAMLRARRVFEYRAWHLQRLQQYQSTVSDRLTLISKWKSYAKMVGSRPGRATLFSDVR